MKLVCRALGWALAAPLACAADSPLTFDAALALAEQFSPSLAALDARQRAAQARITPAGELPDPQLILGLDNLPIGGGDAWSLSRDSMTMQRVGLSQALPNAGKRRARVARAAADAEDAGFHVATNRLALRRAAADAWVAARFAAARLALQADLERENQRFQQSIAARFAAGTANAADTLLPRQEALALAARRDDLDAALAVAEAALARLLGRPAAVAADA
ncbi:MAG: TolC family protein, partial [Gammaproteobacteria bacterium]